MKMLSSDWPPKRQVPWVVYWAWCAHSLLLALGEEAVGGALTWKQVDGHFHLKVPLGPLALAFAPGNGCRCGVATLLLHLLLRYF